ncbi:MAG TPA: chromate transporter [Candidatus Caccocola faecigallinarum]|nr:chromate transporter [Candidatus Caccocola faecigallinarum]
MKELIELYLIFLKLGSVTFGGGLAMFPLLRREFVETRGWITEAELTDYYAVGQCTPGIIAVNVATFVGNKRKGAAGGVIATLGFITAPIIVLTVITAFLRSFADYPIVKDAFAGIRVCVCVLIVNAVRRLWKNSVIDAPTFALFAVVFALSAASPYLPVRVGPAAIVAASLCFGILWNRGKRTK